MVRALLSAIAGWLVFAAGTVAFFRLTGHDPHEPAEPGYMLAAIAFGVVVAFLGGYLASFLAGQHCEEAGKVLALLIAIVAIVSMVAQPGSSVWSQFSALLLMAPAGWAGGYMRVMHFRND